MFTGDLLTAAEAVQLGLINRAVPRAQLMEDCLALARRIADKSPWALRLLKSSMLHGADMPLSAALQHEMATISLVFETDDAHEGCSAFLDKRKPVFKGT
jgi:enoyl-CoA hydratase